MRKLTFFIPCLLFMVAWTGTASLVSTGPGNVKFIEFEEVFRLGDNPVSEEEIFSIVSCGLIDKDRQLYTVDYGEDRVQVFDKHGKFLYTLGRKGQGPGEYSWLLNVIWDYGDNIVINDPKTMKLIFMHRNGEHVKDFSYRDLIKMRMEYPRFLKSGQLLFCTKRREGKPGEILCTIQRLDIETGKLTEIFTCIEQWQVALGSRGDYASAFNYAMQLYSSPEDEIFLVNSGHYEIDVYSQDGDKLRTLTRKYKRVERPAKERQYPIAGNGDKKLYAPKFYDDVKSIHFPLTGQIWVLPSRTVDGKNVLDVFNDQGEFLQQIGLNVPPSDGLTFSRDDTEGCLYLYQVEHSEDDEPIIVCYRTDLASLK